MDRLETSLTELIDRLDVINARLNRIEEAEPPVEVSTRTERAETPPPPPPARVEPQVAEAPARPAAPAAEAPPQQPSRPAPSARRPSPVETANINEKYREGLMLFGKSSMAEARRVFTEVHQADPEGELADNALYWIGETYFNAGEYVEAMKYYRRVEADYADENKAPDAMLKMGLSHVRSGDLLLARAAFEKLIERYPYSTPAAAARNELKRIRY